MKQKPMVINLRDFTTSDHPFGNVQGRQTYNKLAEFIDANPSQTIFGISLSDIVATDASFPRESVIAIAKQYRGEKGFFLEGFKSRDLIDNWNYAARAKDQPLVIWSEEGYELIGPEVSPSVKALLDYIFTNLSVTTSRVANDLHISVQNASTQLKKMVNLGFLMRSEEIAESGGLEYIYKAIK
ncbi:MAG: hypothetical protein PHD01_04495 [Geobacteraceae bacterium]|nr:hypothetical protein [Geobacteraceae bacterium]